MWQGSNFSGYNLNRNLPQFMPSEIHCQQDSTERNGSLRHETTRNVFWSFRKATLECGFVTFPLVSWVRCGTWLYRFLIFAPLLTFHRIVQAWNSITEISIGKLMCSYILVWAHYWSRNGRNNVLIGLPDLAKKKVIENRDKSKITKYLIFPFCFRQRKTIYNFLQIWLIRNWFLILFQVIFSCVLMQHKYDESW